MVSVDVVCTLDGARPAQGWCGVLHDASEANSPGRFGIRCVVAPQWLKQAAEADVGLSGKGCGCMDSVAENDRSAAGQHEAATDGRQEQGADDDAETLTAKVRRIREEMPAVLQTNYLNTGTCGPLPRRTVAAMQRAQEEEL